MSKSDDFIKIVKRVKSVLSTITDEQQTTLIRQGTQTYGLTQDDAKKILQDEGLTIDQSVNYFEVLGLDIKDIESLSEDEIRVKVENNHQPRARKLAPRVGNPKFRAKLDLLDLAKKALLHQTTRQEHIKSIESKPMPKHSDLLFTFATTSDLQLASLIEKNRSAATDILYSGDLAKCLSGTDLVGAAKAVVDTFRSDKSMGMKAMVAIISRKIEFTIGGKVSAHQELATMADKNWDEAKELLYKGFFEIWFKYTNKTELATTTNGIVGRFRDHDIGLEAFIQELNPNIGKPEPEASPPKIDFGTMNINSKEKQEFEIINKSRGKLYGKVDIENDIPGCLEIEDNVVKGKWIVSVEIDTSSLAKQETHSGSLLVQTNGGNRSIPIECYVDNPVQRSIQRVAISSCSVAAIAVITRLILQQFGSSGWLSTQLTGTGFVDWSQYWKWGEWFEWPWFGWRVYTLSEPWADLGSIIAIISFGVGIFGWRFLLKKMREH